MRELCSKFPSVTMIMISLKISLPYFILFLCCFLYYYSLYKYIHTAAIVWFIGLYIYTSILSDFVVKDFSNEKLTLSVKHCKIIL